MKRKWKSDKSISQTERMSLTPAFIGLISIFLISSCIQRDEHRHIPTSKASELDGLSQPANQSVFSDVKTISPSFQSITPEIRSTGVVTYDPRIVNALSARFSGRIEKLYVHFNFESVSKGQRIMDIYSPDILTAQQDLLFRLNNSNQDDVLLNASMQKLSLLGLTDEQISQIQSSKKPITPIPIYSPYSGHIHDIGASNGIALATSTNNAMGSDMNNNATASQPQIENLPSSQTSSLTIKEGMYIQSGQALFSIYNISNVWGILNISPQDASWLKVGDAVAIMAETNPTHIISATISYIEPVAGQSASSIKARVYLKNAESLHLKIGTFFTAKITAAAIKGLWLERSAVVNLGQNQVVFQKLENHFITKTVRTGIVTDSLIQVISGLEGNELVASNAQFMVDSESFIQTESNEPK